MISPASNCCRVDAVKASANQLKLQLAQRKAGAADDNAVHTADQQLRTVDQQVKSGDATKAELALSGAKSAVEQLVYQRTNSPRDAVDSSSSSYGSLDMRA